MADERVEKMRPRGMQYWGSLYGYVGGGYIPLNTTTGDVHDLVAAYDELAARRNRDIEELCYATGHSSEEGIIEDFGSTAKCIEIIAQARDEEAEKNADLREATDPATIRRAERERIVAAARDTQRWVGGNYPAWAHEMFRQFATAVENGDIPENKEDDNAPEQ